MNVNGKVKVTMEANDVGEDLSVIGKDSGIELKEASNEILSSLVIVLVLSFNLF